MSQDHPDLPDLIAVVQEFLSRLAPTLAGKSKFDAQISAHLLGIAVRELADGGRSDEVDRLDYTRLLGREAPLAELKTEFCGKVRRGELDDYWDATVETALAEVIRKVRIVRPDHLVETDRLSAAQSIGRQS